MSNLQKSGNSFLNKESKKHTQSIINQHNNFMLTSLESTELYKNSKKGFDLISHYAKTKVYSILTISGISEKIRNEIYNDFMIVINENHNNVNYDYYLEFEALGETYDIYPKIVEQYLKNRISWLGDFLNRDEKVTHIKDNNEDNIKTNTEIDEDNSENNMIITLTEKDKSFIRDYVELGKDNNDKKNRRKEMAKKFNVSIFIIGAITSWKKNGEKLTLKKSSFTEKIEEKYDKEFIISLSNEYDLSDEIEKNNFLEYLKYCYEDITINDIISIIGNFPIIESENKEKRLISKKKGTGEGSGILLDYNNSKKNERRNKLKLFIEENTNLEDRQKMKILCLPGIECLEIKIYLELGFLPENIIGVEAAEININNINPEMEIYLKENAEKYGIVFDKKNKNTVNLILKKIYLENASKYGIQTRIGKLNNVLKNENTEFDIISLDFLGPINETFRELGLILKFSERAIICTNFLNKREKNNGKKILKAGEFKEYKIKDGKAYQDLVIDRFEKIGEEKIEAEKKSIQLKNAVIKSIIIESGNTPDLIRDVIEKYLDINNLDISNNISFILNTLIILQHRIINNIIDAFNKFKPLCKNINQIKHIEYQIENNISKILALYQGVVFSKYQIEQSEKANKSYSYLGGKNSRMYSDFFIIKKLNPEELGLYNHVLKFFSKLIECELLLDSKYYLKINKKNYDYFDLDDRIVIYDNSGKSIYSITLKDLENTRFLRREKFLRFYLNLKG